MRPVALMSATLLLILLVMGTQQALAQTPVLTGKIESVGNAAPGIVGLDLLVYPDGHPAIRSVFAGTPAYERGLRPGDIILAVNGIDTRGKSREVVDEMISDIPGTPIRFTLKRGERIGDKTVTVRSLNDSSTEARKPYDGLFW